MKKILFTLILGCSFLIQSGDSRTIDKCEVSGSMEGRAKVNLAVVGSVEAKMYCNFEEISEEISKDLSQPGQ